MLCNHGSLRVYSLDNEITHTEKQWLSYKRHHIQQSLFVDRLNTIYQVDWPDPDDREERPRARVTAMRFARGF